MAEAEPYRVNCVPAESNTKLFTINPSIAEKPPVTLADGTSVSTFNSNVEVAADDPDIEYAIAKWTIRLRY